MYRRLHVLISKTEEQAMSQYRTFTAQDAVEYARQFGGLDDPSSLVEAQEIGDGNLNLVFKIFDSARDEWQLPVNWLRLEKCLL